MRMLLNLVLFWLVILCGCTRRPAGVNYFVGAECKATAELKNCNANSPPDCKTISLTWPKGCERVDVYRKAK